jgi:hypothetical protein
MPEKTCTTSLRIVRPPPNRTNDDDVKFTPTQIKESQKAELDALTVTAKADAQHAINAALAVAAATTNKALL